MKYLTEHMALLLRKLTVDRPHGIYTEIGAWFMWVNSLAFFVLFLVPLASGHIFTLERGLVMSWAGIQFILGVGSSILYPVIIHDIRSKRAAISPKSPPLPWNL